MLLLRCLSAGPVDLCKSLSSSGDGECA